MTDPTQTALLAAILAHPEDDTARLAYADWLQENDQHERAEFIRVQCELARCEWQGDLVEPRGHRWAHRENDLIAFHGWRWLWDELPGCPDYWFSKWRNYDIPIPRLGYGMQCRDTQAVVAYSRGFIDSLTCTAADSWLRHADALVWHPEQTVECPSCRYSGIPPRIEVPPGGEDVCAECEGTGRIPRPMPATAQPITRVVLTTIPAVSGWATGHAWLTDDPQRERFPCPHPSDTGMDLRGVAKLLLEARWPGITFELQPGNPNT